MEKYFALVTYEIFGWFNVVKPADKNKFITLHFLNINMWHSYKV